MIIAYNAAWLEARRIHRASAEALRDGDITKEEAERIGAAYPRPPFYTPNIFICIGLFVLTLVIVLLTLGLYFLMFGPLFRSDAAQGPCIGLFALVIYAALEVVVLKYKHLRSGVDDALLWTASACMVTAVNLLPVHISGLAQSALVLALATYGTLRYANPFMAGVAFLSLLAMVFYCVLSWGDIGKVAAPLLVMITSVIVYWVVKTTKAERVGKNYYSCLLVVEALSLLTAYAAVNYFVVRELSNQMFSLHLKDGETIPGGWCFWIATIVMPLFYLFRGIQKRDAVLLRCGLLLVAGIVFTIRAYYHILSMEVAMTAGGIIMVLIAYFITKYLSTPRHGITAADSGDDRFFGIEQSEALILAETFHQSAAAHEKHVNLGGGSGGGAGATGQY